VIESPALTERSKAATKSHGFSGRNPRPPRTAESGASSVVVVFRKSGRDWAGPAPNAGFRAHCNNPSASTSSRMKVNYGKRTLLNFAMTKARMLILLVIAHWVVAVLHLFVAAKVLPAPNNNVGWLAITLITFGHLCVSIAVWKLGDKLAGLVSVLFFLAALGADLYEHFLHASANNVFMLTPGDWTVRFDASVFLLLALEILGCLLGILRVGRGTTRNNSQPQLANHVVVD
jgi:hypothetical protein